MKKGQKVLTNQGGNDLIGFFLHEGHGGDDSKDTVQVGDQLYGLAYREPADRDDAGAGNTYWSLG